MSPGVGRRRKGGLIASVVIALGLALWATAAAGAASATTWVVDNTAANCSDKGPGNSSQPFCTIAAGAKAALSGDTVLVRAGTYSGTSVNPTNSGVTFTANSGVTISGGTKAFSISNRNDVVVSGFTITGTSSYGISVSGGSNVTVSSNVESYAGTPISSPAAGIYLHNLAGGVVSNNITHDNSAHGIYLNGTTTGVVVQGNTSYHNAYQYQRNANGIDDIAPGNSIIGNVTYSNEDSGINIYPGGDNALVSGNVSYNNGDHGIDDYNVTGGRVIGNTIYGNCTTGINVEGTGGYYLLENNVSMNNATGAVINPTTIAINPSTGAPYYTNNCNRRYGNIGVWDSQPLTSSADYNLVYQSNGTSPEYVWAGVTYNTQQALYAATGQEAHGIMADPLFANPGAWDLRLTGASPAVDSADTLASGEQSVDILGHSRVDDPLVANTGNPAGSYYDRGAYEYGPPFSLITASSESATTTQGVAVPVTLQGSDTAACELTFSIVSGPAHGTLGPISNSLCTAGNPNTDSASVTYTPAAGYTGADSFTYQVTDGGSTSNTATVSLTVGGGGGGNLVGNPGFETGLTGWNTSGSGSGVTLSQVAGGHSGTYAGLVTNASSSNSGCTLNDAPNWVTSTSAGTYTGSLWVRAASQGAPLNLRFREYAPGPTGALLGTATSTITLSTAWQLVTVTYTVTTPGTTLDFNAYLTTANSPPGTCFYADDASITLGSPPTAALSVTPSSGTAPVQVTADASGSAQGSTAISTYSFAWGDGTADTGQQSAATANHTYTTAGNYAVTVTVTDSDGTSATATQQVTVSAVTPPTAALTVTPSSGAAPVQVTADASGSTQGSTAISTYSFAWGDGSADTGPQSAGTATHTYVSNGTYTVTVTVTDADGSTATASQQVTVSPATPPTAALSVTPSSGTAPLGVTADASGSKAGSTVITSYTFAWGDGSAGNGPQPASTATHTYASSGTYTVTVTVTDADGTTATASQQVTVSPATPPTAALSVTPSSGTAPLGVTADASGSKAGSTAISTYSFAWGDGSAGTGPQGGATATHTYTSSGTFTVTVTVTDTDGLTATASQSVAASSGANLIGNPGFETGLSGWNTSGSGSGVTLTQFAGGHTGNYSALLTNTAKGKSGCTLNDSPNWVKTTSAGTYTGSIWVKADTAGAPLNLRFREYKGSKLVGSNTSTVTLSTAWQQVTVTYTISSPGTTLDFNAYVSTGNSPPGTCFYADDASITFG